MNSYVLEFYWGLGHVIVEIRNAHKWGSGIMDQISLDLKAEFPGEKGFSTQNLYRMAKFYSFYSGDDNPTVGIIICKEMNKVKAQWTLEGIRKPIGISTYTDNLIQKVEKHLEVLAESEIVQDL